MHYIGKTGKSKGATAPFDYTVEAATVGVPQELVRLVVSGGKYVTMVQGAVPGVAPEAAVPPEIASPSLADQSVVITKVFEEAPLAMVCWIKLAV